MKKYLISLLILVGLTTLVWTQSNQTNFPGGVFNGALTNVANSWSALQTFTAGLVIGPSVNTNIQIVTPTTSSLITANSNLVANGGGLIIAMGGTIGTAPLALGSTTTSVKLLCLPGTELEQTSNDNSGVGFSGYSGSGYYGIPSVGGTASSTACIMTTASGVSANDVDFITNARHSGQDQTFVVWGISVQSPHEAIFTARNIIRCTGCFSGSFFRDNTVDIGYTYQVGAGMVYDSPVNSTIQVPIGAGTNITANGTTCTISGRTLGVGNGTDPALVWAVPTNGGGSLTDAAHVTVTGANGAGINVTNVQVSKVFGNGTSFSYPCTGNEASDTSNAITYTVLNDAGGNNAISADVFVWDHNVIALGSSGSGIACLIEDYGAAGKWAGSSSVWVSNSECDGGTTFDFRVEPSNVTAAATTSSNFPFALVDIRIDGLHMETNGHNNLVGLSGVEVKGSTWTNIDMPCGGTTGCTVLQTVSVSGPAPSAFFGWSIGKVTASGTVTFTLLNDGINTQTWPATQIAAGNFQANLCYWDQYRTDLCIAQLPMSVYSTASATQSGSLTATTMYTTPSSRDANFVITFYAVQIAAGASCTGPTEILANVIFTDPTGSVTATIPVGTFQVATNGAANTPIAPFLSGTAPNQIASNQSYQFIAKRGTTIQYSTTYTLGSSCSPGPTYVITPLLSQI